ncbi:MAG: hypothetical protein K9I82_01505 [Chitinophagaceae bacterium]|nr:hypothetical protein [Chitinophagaceae bacterium]
MERDTIEKIFNFLKEKEGKELPKNWGIIKELENHPDDVQYRHDGTLSLFDTGIKKLPKDLYVDRNLFLSGCKQLTELPDKLHVGYILSLSYTNISELPNNLYVGGDLYIENTPLAKKYTDAEMRKIVTSAGGEINGHIFR